MGNWHSHTEKLQRLASAEVALLEHSASPDKCHWQTACTDIRVASNDYTIHSIQVTPLPGSNANSSDDDTPLILLHGFMVRSVRCINNSLRSHKSQERFRLLLQERFWFVKVLFQHLRPRLVGMGPFESTSWCVVPHW